MESIKGPFLREYGSSLFDGKVRKLLTVVSTHRHDGIISGPYERGEWAIGGKSLIVQLDNEEPAACR